MTDNKQLKEVPIRNKVDARAPYEAKYLHLKYPWLSHETVKAAVDKYSHDRNKIENYLDSLSHTK